MIPNIPLKSVINSGTCQILRVRELHSCSNTLLVHHFRGNLDLSRSLVSNPEKSPTFDMPFPPPKQRLCIQILEVFLHLGRMAADY